MAVTTLQGIRALVLDIDGVLYHAGEPIPGGPEALEEIRQRGYALRFLTNITRRSRATVAERLRAMGYTVDPEEVLTASYLTASYLRRLGRPRCWVLLDGDGLQEFGGVELSQESPDYVVLGDLAESFSYGLLNRVLRALWQGAGFIAMQADPYDLGREGPTVNVGGWLALLERASGRRATLIGKPSPIAFRMALEELRATPREAAVVGDRVESDIAGGKNAGMRTILVRTGHFRPQDLEGSVQPDLVIPSLADLPRHLP
jgi:HAD superfamily hydrolase (TIGR01458 family)